MKFSTFVLFLTFVVVAKCSVLPENHEIIKELSKAVNRLEANVAEADAKRDEEVKILRQENNDLSETIHRMEVKVAETVARRDADRRMIHETEARRGDEMKQIKQENNDLIAHLSEAMHRLESKFEEVKVKKNDEMKQMKKDIDLLNAEFD